MFDEDRVVISFIRRQRRWKNGDERVLDEFANEERFDPALFSLCLCHFAIPYLDIFVRLLCSRYCIFKYARSREL
jgi:hypothetical protein